MNRDQRLAPIDPQEMIPYEGSHIAYFDFLLFAQPQIAGMAWNIKSQGLEHKNQAVRFCTTHHRWTLRQMSILQP